MNIGQVGSTGNSRDYRFVDDSGLPVPSLVAATFPTLTWSLAGAHADVAFPALSDLSTITSSWVAGGVKERGNGVYRVDEPDTMYTAGGLITVRGEATGKRLIIEPLQVAPPIYLQGILTTALTETGTGYLAAAFKKLFDVLTPVLTAASVNQTGDAYAQAVSILATVNSGTYGNASIMTLCNTIAGYIDTEIASILAKTNLIPSSPAAVGSPMTLQDGSIDVLKITDALANRLADHIWRRNYANIRASAYGETLNFRSGLGAQAKLVNKLAAAGGVLTINHEDDSSAFGTQSLTTDANAQPIIAADTV